MKLSFVPALAAWLAAAGFGCTLTGRDLEPERVVLPSGTPGDGSVEFSLESGPSTTADGAAPTAGAVVAQSEVVDLEGTSLIDNSDAESGLAGWTANFGGSLSVSDEQSRSGLHSVLLTDRESAYQGVHRDVTAEVAPGEAYSLRAFALIRGARADVLLLTVQLACAGLDDSFQQIDRTTGSHDRWRALDGSFAMPDLDECTPLRISSYVEGPAPGVDLFVDDFQIVKRPRP